MRARLCVFVCALTHASCDKESVRCSAQQIAIHRVNVAGIGVHYSCITALNCDVHISLSCGDVGSNDISYLNANVTISVEFLTYEFELRIGDVHWYAL